MKSFRNIVILMLLAFSLGAIAQSKPEIPVVDTKYGKLQGTEHSGVKIFKGVPYATPPVGELRWKETQPLKPWKGIRKADQFGPVAMQIINTEDWNLGTDKMSEDCLYLNIWTPTKTMDEKLPVLVYIHGGGLSAGSGSEPRYNGESMARKGIVLVSINYRLGIFGYFAYPGLREESPNNTSGDYGFLDQVAALKWVKENIAVFGGNPDKITIAGESAGSISVSELMCSPLSKGLFQQAIGSSASALGTMMPVPLDDAEKNGQVFAQSKGYKSLEELRAAPAEELLDQKSKFPSAIDGYFMPKSPEEIYSNGEQAHIPLLVGWNSQEIGNALPARMPNLNFYTLQGLVNMMSGGQADKVFELYEITNDSTAYTGGTQLFSDQWIGFGTWKWSELHKTTSGQKVFRYLFCHCRPEKKTGNKNNGLNLPKITGAVHADDIEYAMGTLPTNRLFDWQPQDFIVSNVFQGYYVNFVKTGNPNGLGLPEWTAVNDQVVPPVMQIDVNSYEKTDSTLEARYKFFQTFFAPLNIN